MVINAGSLLGLPFSHHHRAGLRQCAKGGWALQTDTHLHFLMDLCEGGELYALLTAQPNKRFRESHVRFYAAEVRVRLQLQNKRYGNETGS